MLQKILLQAANLNQSSGFGSHRQHLGLENAKRFHNDNSTRSIMAILVSHDKDPYVYIPSAPNTFSGGI